MPRAHLFIYEALQNGEYVFEFVRIFRTNPNVQHPIVHPNQPIEKLILVNQPFAHARSVNVRLYTSSSCKAATMSSRMFSPPKLKGKKVK